MQLLTLRNLHTLLYAPSLSSLDWFASNERIALYRMVDTALALATLLLFFSSVSSQYLHTVTTEVDDSNAVIIYAADTNASPFSQWSQLNASTAAACSTCVSRGLDPTRVWGGKNLQLA